MGAKMAEIRGWDTNGVTKTGALRDGRLNLQFTGKDGQILNIFVPAESIANLIVSLIAFCAKIEKPHDVGDTLSGFHHLAVREIGVAAARDGSEFSLVVTTRDNLELRFRLAPNTIEALAGGLIATLSEHGRSPIPMHPEGSRH